MKLKDICDVFSGFALKEFNDSCEGCPVIKIGNINTNGTLNLEDCQYSTEEINKKYYSNNRDIYIALSGATTGKIGIMNTDEKYIINQRVGIVRQKNNEIPQEFIKYFLLNCTERILREASGCAQPNISPKQIAEYNIPDVSSESMKKISSVLEEVDKLIAYRKQELQKLDELIKARFVEMFGDPATNTKQWPIKTLPEIAEYWNGLTYKPEDVSDKGTIVLRSSNIQNSALNFSDTVRVSCKIGEKKYVQNNDILMCSRNGSSKLVGKVALIKDVKESMSFGAFMMIVRSDYFPYLITYFQMPTFRTQITTGATSTINQITGKMLDNVKLPVPDLGVINEYAKFVKQVDKSKVAIQKSLDLYQELFDKLMNDYFGD